MADLSLYKVDLDTPQPNGRNGESPRAAFTKYNDALDEIGGGFVEKEEGKGLSTNDYDNTAKQKVDAMGSAASRDVTTSSTDATQGRLLKVGDALTFVSSGHNKSFSTFNSNPNDTNAWNAFSNSSIRMREANNAMSFLLGGTTNNRVGGIQVGHVSEGFADVLGVLSLNPLGGGVQINGRTAYHMGNVLNAVSQVGGVPTGGLMDWGETPNGRFFRYANGNQICLPPTHFYTLTEGASLTWVFPANFITTPQVTIEAGSADTTIGFDKVWVKLGGNSPNTNTTQAVINYALNASATQFNSRLQIYAVGRWY